MNNIKLLLIAARMCIGALTIALSVLPQETH